MTGWLTLTDEQRRISLEQASVHSGIQTKAIEKDWWVTLCLKALFSTSYADHCIFKGGTSLSKGWKLLQRFSEDVDIALDPEAFGMHYRADASHSYVKKLKRAGCAFTSTTLKEALANALKTLGVPEGMVTIEAEPVPSDLRDKDPQTLFIRYLSLFDRDAYLADEVKMEFGVRSLKDPYAPIMIQSILSEAFPNPAYPETAFTVMAVEPHKTLLEKIFLLHEKFMLRFPQSIQGDRQSRHLYDIVQLMKTDAVHAVLEDPVFYSRLQEHRRHYVRLSGFNYDTLHPDSINFVPHIEHYDFFREDYMEMQRSMIYGNSPDFDDLLNQLKLFNGRFRLVGSGLVLEELIELFLEEHKDVIKADPNRLILSSILETTTASGEAIAFSIRMHRRRDKWVFEKLKKVRPIE